MKEHWWMQYTWVNGEQKRDPIHRTDEEMIRLLGQVSFLRQAGEEITLGAEHDDAYRITAYIVRRPNCRTGNVVNRFERVEEN